MNHKRRVVLGDWTDRRALKEISGFRFRSAQERGTTASYSSPHVTYDVYEQRHMASLLAWPFGLPLGPEGTGL